MKYFGFHITTAKEALTRSYLNLIPPLHTGGQLPSTYTNPEWCV